jgi:NhaP-type Na+/H+ or K+/H+ antiporter
LALPAVLTFAAALDATSSHFVWWHFVLQDVGLGLAFGLACGLVGSLLLPPSERLRGSIPEHQQALFALGVAFATYGATVLPPHGNGFIAVFVAAIVLGIRRPDVRERFAEGSQEIVEVVKLGVFVVFGSLLTVHGLFTDGLSAVFMVALALLAARPIAIAIALAGTRVGATATAFMAWFGPKGVATIAFSLLVLERHIAAAPRIFNLAALVVCFSIVLHGLTDTLGPRWISRRQTPERALA